MCYGKMKVGEEKLVYEVIGVRGRGRPEDYLESGSGEGHERV